MIPHRQNDSWSVVLKTRPHKINFHIIPFITVIERPFHGHCSVRRMSSELRIHGHRAVQPAIDHRIESLEIVVRFLWLVSTKRAGRGPRTLVTRWAATGGAERITTIILDFIK